MGGMRVRASAVHGQACRMGTMALVPENKKGRGKNKRIGSRPWCPRGEGETGME